ncbi:MAG: type IX secretion system membrane protein PorP/SprF [Bacteroidia bacterium]|nr:type IX secretion system membrane protein PorP/SprF [Bacteroidia bacterium]MCF8426993.1 type IX secretion system membrane protein PorP/SprF [Bacteroidia bacterium]MCF8445612.1 type IX secretion system membrane protein PorP/SprF [Bacteroidia bacterium]
MLFLLGTKAWAQDPQFSQFYANPVYTNPAFAGSVNNGRIVMNARNQWPSISGAFRTGSFSYDEHFDAINGGFAVQANYDEQGVGTLRTTSLNLIYAYQIPVTRKFTIRAGIQAGFMQKTIDFGKLLWFDQIVATQGFINPTSEPNGNGTILMPNFAAGFIGYSKSFYGGFAAHNLFEPNQTFFNGAASPIPRRYTAHAGLVLPIIRDRNELRQVNLYPNVLVKMQRQFNQVNLGMYANKGPYMAGAYFRQNSVNSDAFILLIGLRTQKVKVGYSYDRTVSAAKTGAVNSHELSLAFELKKRVPRSKPRKVTCPDF